MNCPNCEKLTYLYSENVYYCPYLEDFEDYCPNFVMKGYENLTYQQSLLIWERKE